MRNVSSRSFLRSLWGLMLAAWAMSFAAHYAQPEPLPETACAVHSATAEIPPFRCPICGGEGTDDLELLIRIEERLFLLAVR